MIVQFCRIFIILLALSCVSGKLHLRATSYRGSNNLGDEPVEESPFGYKSSSPNPNTHLQHFRRLVQAPDMVIPRQSGAVYYQSNLNNNKVNDNNSNDNNDNNDKKSSTSNVIVYIVPAVFIVAGLLLGRYIAKKHHLARMRARAQAQAGVRIVISNQAENNPQQLNAVVIQRVNSASRIGEGRRTRHVRRRRGSVGGTASSRTDLNPEKAERKGIKRFHFNLPKEVTPIEEEQCKICFFLKKDVTLFPCHHELCHQCLKHLSQCPFCRSEISDAKPVKEVQKTFLSTEGILENPIMTRKEQPVQLD